MGKTRLQEAVSHQDLEIYVCFPGPQAIATPKQAIAHYLAAGAIATPLQKKGDRIIYSVNPTMDRV